MKDKNKNKVENESGYMAMGICLGMSLGAALGLVLFHNLAVGMSTGMCIGFGLCANAKEDGKDEAFQTQPKEEERGR